MNEEVKKSLIKLTDFCIRESFKGHDPYDGLNSTFFQAIPLIARNRLARLIWIQALKKLPFNLRGIVGIKKDFNPKALGLFISGYCNLYEKENRQEYLDKIILLYNKLLTLKNSDWSGICWGYNFDWQSRAFFLPKNTPTVVVTSFIGNSVLDIFEITKKEEFLKLARDTCNFILKDLNRNYDDKGNFAFSYSPLDKSVVFNASLLGSSLLARVYSITNEKELIDAAKKSVAYCCAHQKYDGSWAYGTHHSHNWVDNFHTGYNLECIANYGIFSGDSTYQENLNKGFNYYINSFFKEEGISKYYNNSVYPIDIHAPAQLIITLSKLGQFENNKQLADRVLKWTIRHMQSDKGYFYYQIGKYFTSKIPYMRWAQAWMFYAISEYLLKTKE
jgi:rhamnogalacturonyl hydrolase YesR